MLCQLTGQIVKNMNEADLEKQDLLKVITSPFTKKVIQVRIWPRDIGSNVMYTALNI